MGIGIATAVGYATVGAYATGATAAYPYPAGAQAVAAG